MRKRVLFHFTWVALSLLISWVLCETRVEATDNQNGAKVSRVSASRPTLQASRQIDSGQPSERRAGARLEGAPRANKIIISVDSFAAKTSRNPNGKRIVIGPRPLVQRISKARARALGWTLYE